MSPAAKARSRAPSDPLGTSLKRHRDPVGVALSGWLAAGRSLGPAFMVVLRQPRLIAGLVLSVAAWNFVGEVGLIVLLVALVCATASFVVKRPHVLRNWWRKVWVYQRRWHAAMVACRLSVEDKIPRRRRLRQVAWGERILVSLPLGVSPEDVQAQSARLASAFKSVQCRVRDDKPGRVWLEFSDGRALREAIPCPPFPERTDLAAIRLGNREDGSPWTIEVRHPERGYNHLFIAGMTGAGKSVTYWQAMREFASAIQAGTLELRVVDGKEGVEFGPARDWFGEYADEPKAICELLEKAVRDMQEYGRYMKQIGTSQHEPTISRPAIGILIDEIVSLLRDCDDPKLAARMEKAIRLLLRQGRACGFFVWAATQDPSVESFPLRKFFSMALGLRMAAANQPDMVFGRGARDAGATCDKIRKDMPGTGIEIREDGVSMVRTAHVTAADRAELLERFGRHTWRVRDDRDRRALDEEFNVDEGEAVDA